MTDRRPVTIGPTVTATNGRIYPLSNRNGGLIKECDWTTDELAALIDAYHRGIKEPVDLAGLAKKLGRNKANVCRKARALGLTNQRRYKTPGGWKPSQPRFATDAARRQHQSVVARERIARDGHPRGALGLRHTEATKAVIRAKGAAYWSSMTQEERDDLIFRRVQSKREKGIPFANPRGSWKAGWREVGASRCFFRSRWEANYARYLEWLRANGLIASWEHEAQTFWFEGIKRGCVSYLPDFKVVGNDGCVQWHEVKGWMDARSKTTLARMARYHPAEVLVVIREKQYVEIERKVSALIDGWERSA